MKVKLRSDTACKHYPLMCLMLYPSLMFYINICLEGHRNMSSLNHYDLGLLASTMID